MARSSRPLIECPICGQRMKRITATHLKSKHSMTMETFRERYGDVVATDQSQVLDLSDPSTMQSLTSKVIGYIVQDAQVDDIAKQAIQQLLRDQDGRFRIALNLAAVHQIQSLDGLLHALDKIRTTLLSDRRLAGMTDANLAKTHQIIEKSVDRILNYVKSLSIDRSKKTGGLFEQTNVVNIFQHDPDAPPAPATPASREKIRTLFSGLVNALHDTDLPASPGKTQTQEIEDADFTEVSETADQAGDRGAPSTGGGLPGSPPGSQESGDRGGPGHHPVPGEHDPDSTEPDGQAN